MSVSDKLFLGLEISTQQVKVIAVDDDLNIVYEDGIKFDDELPEFKTEGGVHIHSDRVTVTVPTLMWVKALDVAFERMKASNFNFVKVKAISGTGQQHGSVYWRIGARQVLQTLDPSKSLSSQLEDCFSISESPIWMDSSTDQQCRDLEEKLGGPLRLSEITGCRAYHRFTGNQIAKIFATKEPAYKNTERISLVSSFGACLLAGDYIDIDESDASGMNLMDLRTRRWSAQCLQAYGVEGLENRLGNIVKSSACVGAVSHYLVDRCGFAPDCKLIAFTGDNPASLAGMCPRPGDIILSLGTSDTVIMWIECPRASLEGCIFVNPVDTHAYMGILCFKNGSLTRERVRNICTQGSWDEFTAMLELTTPGNNGNIGIYFDVTEITPNAVGVYRFDTSNQQVSSFVAAVEVRALIEGQFMAKRVHAENLGYALGPTGRVLATGGASNNKAILQVLCDVFNTPVYTQNVANSACLGCAYRAKHGYLGGSLSYQEVVSTAPVNFECAATPNSNARQIYDPLVARYRTLELQVAS